MITSISVKNFMVFNDTVCLELETEDKGKKYRARVYEEGGHSIVTSAFILGPNNAGKSCFIKAVRCLRDIMLGDVHEEDLQPNPQAEDNVVTLDMTFCYEGNKYEYYIRYDCTPLENGKKKGFVHESLSRMITDPSDPDEALFEGFFVRDVEKGDYKIKESESLGAILKDFPSDTPAVYAPQAEWHSGLEDAQEILEGIASRIDVVDMNGISMDKTVEWMRGGKQTRNRIIQFLQGSGTYIEDLAYVENRNSGESSGAENDGDDCMNLYSFHDGMWHRCMEYDSDGTKKLVALAGYIADALDSGRILIVDDLTRYVHSSLAGELMIMFGTDFCNPSQLIFTAADASLLDGNRKRLRMYQVFILNRDEDGIDLHSLARLNEDLTEDKDFSDGNWIEMYRNGCFGGIPDHDDMLQFMFDIPGKGKNA